MPRTYLGEGIEDAIVTAGVVELVGAVVGKKELKGTVKQIIVVRGMESVEIVGIAECATNEHGCAIADVAGNQRVGKGWFADVREGSVYGVAEVERGVDERAIEIKDQKARWNTKHTL